MCVCVKAEEVGGGGGGGWCGLSGQRAQIGHPTSYTCLRDNMCTRGTLNS